MEIRHTDIEIVLDNGDSLKLTYKEAVELRDKLITLFPLYPAVWTNTNYKYDNDSTYTTTYDPNDYRQR